MSLLCIESSGSEGSIATLANGSISGVWKFESPRGRGGAMFPALQSAVESCGRIATVVVGSGPGGYNGLRMAMAAGWGIAQAHSAQLFGVPSLLGYDAPEYFVAGDARGGQWFFAHVAGGQFVEPPALLPPASLREQIVSGLPVFVAAPPSPFLPEAISLAPSAAILATRAGAFGPAEPVYLKPPHISTPTGRFT